MAWLGSSARLAVELAPSTWTLVAAERVAHRDPAFVAAAAFPADAVSLCEDIRGFRRQHQLGSDAALVYWPEPDDPGVSTLDSRSSAALALPKARVIRQRVAPFVQAGGRVREVLLPHEAIGRLVALAGWPSACVLSMLTSMACLAVVQDDFIQSAYLAWAPTSAVRGDADRLLARYQLAARMMPHLRRWLASAPAAHVAVCGDFPDLRSAMVPIVEELDREVDVLDAALVGQAWDDRAEPNEIAGRQLAWAVAAGGAR